MKKKKKTQHLSLVESTCLFIPKAVEAYDTFINGGDGRGSFSWGKWRSAKLETKCDLS